MGLAHQSSTARGGKSSRRSENLSATERAHQQGWRRRATDRQEQRAYFVMLILMLTIFLTLGVLSWLAQ